MVQEQMFALQNMGLSEADLNQQLQQLAGIANQSSFGLNVQPGYQWEVQRREHALTKYVEQLQADTAKDIANINRRTQVEIANKDRALQEQLQRNQIDTDKYLQGRALAQQESEFARDMALKTLISDRQNKIDEAGIELGRLAEIRQERELQAQLAANPRDFVAYELYKRMLPGASQQSIGPASQQSWDLASTFAQGNQLVGTQAGDTNLLDQPYAAAPPAYDDNTLSNVAKGIFGQSNEVYNPNLSGTGIFGANIPGPQQFSRAMGNNITDQELGILQSFLGAGVDMGGGSRTAIDPAEWLQQAEKSWIPTLSSLGDITKYA